MNALDQLNGYLRSLLARMRFGAVSLGIAITLASALVATVLLVLMSNALAFSPMSVLSARILLFLTLALAIGFGIVRPLLRLDGRRAARKAEEKFPEFQERLITLAERDCQPGDPFVELLAEDTVEVAERAQPKEVVGTGILLGGLSAGAAALAILIWLGVAGPGFLGYGTSLLWAGAPRGAEARPFYSVLVQPGDRTVRRRSDQIISAELVGFQAPGARLFAKYSGTSKWEPVPMHPQPGGTNFEFLFAGIAETVEYYVEAGAVRSAVHTLSVIDLPSVKHIKVTYHYPKWLGSKVMVEDPGGDLRAVEGTEAEVAIETDLPLRNGVLVIDNETRIPLKAGEGNWLTGRVPIQQDGMYYVASVEQGEPVRLSEDFFIEAQQEMSPIVRIRRPGRDAKVNPIEEVTVQIEAEDDFGLQEMALHYSVNGGDEKTVPLLKNRGATEASGRTVLALEDFNLVPGDVVAMYATARDARNTTRSDIFFIQARPFELEFSQSQQAGGGGGGGGEQENQISERQKEIISATWNQLRNQRSKKDTAEEARFLSEIQSKLRDQAKSLAQRMNSRQLSGQNQEFQKFSKDMEAAADAMAEASEKLKQAGWRDALAPEQKALQHLLRAEATFRQIQVAFGNRGGGGGGGAGRDLENLFDLELDTEKNQYETGQQSQSAEQRAREVDEALQKLEQLARRQQELAQQSQQNKQQSFQQRWQQEMLRREAEELRRKMEQLSRGNSSSQQSSSQQSSSQQSGQQGSQSSASRSGGGQERIDPRIERAIQQLRQATEDMRRAGSQDGASESRRAAERLQEARDLLGGMRQQEASERMENLARRAEQLASQQRDFVKRLGEMYAGQDGSQPRLMPGTSRQQILEMGNEKLKMHEELQRLEREMQRAVRDMAGSQRGASSKLRDALGEMHKDELALRMKLGGEWIRRGLGAAALPREAPVTAGLNRLSEQVRQAQGSLDKNTESRGELGQALDQVERLREQLDRMTQAARAGREGQQQGRGQNQGQQQGQGQQGQQAQGQGQQGQQGEQGQGQQGQGGEAGQGSDRMGERQAGGTRGGGSYSAMNTGDRRVPPGIASGTGMDAAGIERTYRESLRDLNQLRQSLRGIEGAPDGADRDVQELIRQMSQLDPRRFPGNPEMVEQLRTQVLPAIEQLELQLRRQLDEGQSGQVRSGATDRVPPGYADAVAEYFRRLSRGR
ncbi:MAG: hypothetical protein ACK5AZ_07005 [Bryobacteraceae bacterium]